MACTLVANVLVSQAGAVYYKDSKWADAETPFGLFAFSEAIEWSAKDPIFGDLTSQKVRPGYLVGYNGDDAVYSSFEDLYSAFADPAQDELLSTLKNHTSTEDEGTAVLNCQSPLAMMIGAAPSGDITLEDQLVVSGRKAQLGIDDVNEKITLNLNGGIKVTDGGTLVIMNDRTAQAMGDMNLEIVLGDSILVEDGGCLILQSVDALKNTTEDVGGIPTQRNTIVAPEGKPAIVVDGGTVNVSHQTLKRSDGDSSNEALIQVKRGEVSFEPSSGQSAQTGLPQFSGNPALASDKFNFELDNGDSTAPAISVEDDASVTIKTGDFTASGDGAIFELADGATLNLEGGTITSEGETPAITVGSGATVVIPEDSKAEIKSEGGNAAIDLAPGANVQQGGNTITVAPVEDESASNYVDNHGNIVLESGSEDGKFDPNTVIQPDGTAISGKDELPTVEDDGSVTLPSGGATVTNPDGESVEVPEGGELNDIYIGVSEGNGSDTLKTSATIVAGQTLDLQAVGFNNANLSNYECSVESSDSNVATAEVTDDGITDDGITVTAKGVGSATITATFTLKDETRMFAADKDSLTAKFNVTVTAAPIAVTGVTLDKTTLNLDEGDTHTLTATVQPENATNKAVTWSTSDAGVATVENGVVKAVSRGIATITVTTADGSFTATCSVDVDRRSSGGGSSSSTTYAVSVEDSKNGSVSVSPKRAEKGDTVTITVKPDTGYELDELIVTDKNGDKIKLTEKDENKFTFKMPGSKVTVETSFKLIETEPENPFTDISKNDYFYDAVLWAADKGITSGVTDTLFAPNASCTRAQMVTFLWRANGSPVVDYAMNFTDVPADAYYADAVRWAVSKGITSGTSATTFAPDMTVTRAQTVTFLYRAAGTPSVSGGSFADVDANAYYADAVAWAVSEGITSGTSATTFSPDAACTRGQIVTFLYRAQ